MLRIVVPARFNGPPDSANGGYTAGLVARSTARRPLASAARSSGGRSAGSAASAALYGDDGAVLARAEQVWITKLPDKEGERP